MKEMIENVKGKMELEGELTVAEEELKEEIGRAHV